MHEEIAVAGGVPIYNWSYGLDDNALEQACNLARLPFAFHHTALMPDCHSGYGMPIGGVFASDGVIIPNAVGVDIGCGMQIMRTGIRDIDSDTIKKIFTMVRKYIPVGFAHATEKIDDVPLLDEAPDIDIIQAELENAKYQLGTLGGGNHFMEIQKGSDGYIYLMVHSGSRNFGLKIAQHYHRLAIKLCNKWKVLLPTHELAYLPVDSDEGQEYIKAMQYAVKFAYENRCIITHLFDDIAWYVTEYKGGDGFAKDVAHNYAALENHFGRNVWVHRKGAIRARKNDFGIIPGSQGSKSYIVTGKGNPDSFCSCSHGAGRIMGRKEAQKELDLDETVKELDDKGIVHSIRNVNDLDEAPGAYKNIDEVMAQQTDLVEIDVELEPLGVIKG